MYNTSPELSLSRPNIVYRPTRSACLLYDTFQARIQDFLKGGGGGEGQGGGAKGGGGGGGVIAPVGEKLLFEHKQISATSVEGGDLPCPPRIRHCVLKAPISRPIGLKYLKSLHCFLERSNACLDSLSSHFLRHRDIVPGRFVNHSVIILGLTLIGLLTFLCK